MTARFRSKNIADALGAMVGALTVLALVATPQAQSGRAQQTGQVPRAQTPPPAQPATPGQAKPATPAGTQNGKPSTPTPAPLVVPADYVIGPDDVLSIVYWREKDVSSDVTVRPDGKISLPLLNDVQAAGLTPAQLRDRLTEVSRQYLEDPNVTVVVHQINSRKVYITGEVAKPGTYPLTGPTTVLQLIALAGGIGTYANGTKIMIVRHENGQQVTYPFNYKDVASGKSLKRNIELKPGDTVIVP
jgi:polysaccharide export outer membrane protein